MTDHHLKTWQVPFDALWDGSKTFEVRRNDRDFKVGDTLTLQEWFVDHVRWGERIIDARISYILHGGFGLEPGFCCLSLTDIRKRFYEGETEPDREDPS
jgi:hypothetical protein